MYKQQTDCGYVSTKHQLEFLTSKIIQVGNGLSDMQITGAIIYKLTKNF